MKTYVDDILEQKSKQQKLIQALGILEIPFTKFHTLYLGDKLIELRQLFDEAMIERVRAYHHCKQTAELNCKQTCTCVDEPVSFQTIGLGESSMANVTFIWFLSGMNPRKK